MAGSSRESGSPQDDHFGTFAAKTAETTSNPVAHPEMSTFSRGQANEVHIFARTKQRRPHFPAENVESTFWRGIVNTHAHGVHIFEKVDSTFSPAKKWIPHFGPPQKVDSTFWAAGKSGFHIFRPRKCGIPSPRPEKWGCAMPSLLSCRFSTYGFELVHRLNTPVGKSNLPTREPQTTSNAHETGAAQTLRQRHTQNCRRHSGSRQMALRLMAATSVARVSRSMAASRARSC